jgi:hypothetical protein
MSDITIRRLESRITALTAILEDSIQQKVSDLTTQLTEVETKLNEVKANSYYKYSITGECEGAFDSTSGRLLNLSYGSGASNEHNFALYISHACRIHHMTFMSVFGTNEVINPEVQLTIHVVKFPENELVISYPFPNVASGEPIVHHTGFTSEEMYLDIPAGVMIYVFASVTNLVDENNRHRLSFEFKTNLF